MRPRAQAPKRTAGVLSDPSDMGTSACSDRPKAVDWVVKEDVPGVSCQPSRGDTSRDYCCDGEQAAMSRKAILLISCFAVLSVSCNKWPTFRIGSRKQEPLTGSQDVADKQTGAYWVEGILAFSEVFTGGPNAPKRFVIRNLKSNAIEAYVQSTKGAVSLYEHVGRHVRILGETHMDQVSGRVVEAENVVVLEAGE